MNIVNVIRFDLDVQGSWATASDNAVLRTPASTWATRLARSILRTLFIRAVETTTPFSKATHPPVSPVPLPRGTIWILRSARKRTTRTTSSVVIGKTTAPGVERAIVKPSES